MFNHENIDLLQLRQHQNDFKIFVGVCEGGILRKNTQEGAKKRLLRLDI